MKEIVILAAIILLSASCALVPDGVYQEPTNSAVMSEMEGIADDSSQDKSSSYVNVAFAYYEDVSEDRERHVTIEYPQVFNLSNADSVVGYFNFNFESCEWNLPQLPSEFCPALTSATHLLWFAFCRSSSISPKFI